MLFFLIKLNLNHNYHLNLLNHGINNRRLELKLLFLPWPWKSGPQKQTGTRFPLERKLDCMFSTVCRGKYIWQMTTILCDKSMIPSINFKKYISQATYHKINLEVIRNILKAFEANSNLIAGVVQVPEVHYDDLITRLHWGWRNKPHQCCLN